MKPESNNSQDNKVSKLIENTNLLQFNLIITLFQIQNDVPKIYYVMREIRNRISKKKYYKIKNLTLFSIIYYDIFGLKNEKINNVYELLKNKE